MCCTFKKDKGENRYAMYKQRDVIKIEEMRDQANEFHSTRASEIVSFVLYTELWESICLIRLVSAAFMDDLVL